MKTRICFLLVCLMLISTAGCQGATPIAQTSVPEISTSVPAEATSAPSAGQFDGITVIVAGPDPGVRGMELVKQKWEDETGGKVEILPVPFGEMLDKFRTSMSTNTYLADIFMMPADLGGDAFGGGYVYEVPDYVKDTMNWDDILPAYKQVLMWGGKLYGAPWDADVLTMYYRKDIIDDPNNQAKFKNKYGYDLAVPQSWAQYRDIAEFFTGWDWDNSGKEKYGFVELPMRKNQGWNGYMTRAACYAKHPDDPGFFFDPETMDARINNPGFVKALEDWVAMLPYGPPDMVNYGWSENAQAFVGGVAALDIQWGDIGPMSLDPSSSAVKGKVGFASAPGCTQTYNPKTKAWDDFPSINKVTFQGFNGHVWVVPKAAKNVEAAWSLVSYIDTPEARTLAMVAPGTGVQPSSYAQLKAIDVWVGAGFTEEDAKGYVGMIEDALGNKNSIADLRLPGFAEYQDAIELAVSIALAKQATPQEALDAAAKTWNEITDRLGRDLQLKLYREALGLQ